LLVAFQVRGSNRNWSAYRSELIFLRIFPWCFFCQTIRLLLGGKSLCRRGGADQADVFASGIGRLLCCFATLPEVYGSGACQSGKKYEVAGKYLACLFSPMSAGNSTDDGKQVQKTQG
jgi:hypothetical protein